MAPEQPNDNGGTELGRFLRARRSQVTPTDVGFAPGSGVRRTPGLRREEVAALAGVSIDYYTRLERGKETRPSPSVTDALARALKLDPDEHEHLRALAARAARYAPEPPTAPSRTVRPQLKLLLETLRPNPAYITSRTLDVLAAARLWERYDVTRRAAGQKKTFHHPTVGTLTLGFQGMQLEGTPGQRLGIYLAEAGTPDYDAMILLDMTAPAAAESQPRNNNAVPPKERTDR